MPAPSSLLLQMADGRFPLGGHAQSGGLEAAVAAGRVCDAGQLEQFLLGRLATQGLVDAALAAAAALVPAEPAEMVAGLAALDAEAAARCPSAALRAVSRAQGRAAARAARVVFPEGEAGVLGTRFPGGAMFPVAFGALARAAGLSGVEVALLVAQHSVSTPAWAATRLIGLDPLLVVGVLVRLAGAVDRTASEAEAAGQAWTAGGSSPELPSGTATQLELDAEDHAGWEVRLFAS